MLHKELTFPFLCLFSKSIPKWVFEVLFYCISGFIFLGCINFFGKQGIFILVSLILSLVYIFLKNKYILDWVTIFAFVFAVSYCVPSFIFYPEFFTTTLMYAFSLLIFIQLFNCVENKRKFLFWIGLSFAVGLYVSFLLTFIMTYWTQGLLFGGEAASNFWTHAVVSRTGVSLYFMAFLGMCVATLLFANKLRKWFSIPIILFLIFLPIWFSLEIGNRSFLLAFAFLVYFALFIKVLLSKKWVFWISMIIIFSLLVFGVLIVIILENQGAITIPEELMQIPAINRLFTVDPSEGRPEILRKFFTSFSSSSET